MKAIVNVLFVVVLAVMMVTASALFTAGYTSISVLAKKKADSGKSKSSDSGSGGNDGSDKGVSSDQPKPKHEEPQQTDTPSDIGTQPPTGDQQTDKPTDQQPIVTDKPIAPANDKPQCMIESCGPIPDKGCAFHPNSDSCKPDFEGNCPSGFAHNDKGNCFPEGPCPQGSSRHDDDESGTCFPINRPIHCPPGFFPRNGVCNKDIFIIIHNTIHSSSSGSTHGLSKGCFDAIKIAWLGKVHRGQNSEVDNFIDNCLGAK